MEANTAEISLLFVMPFLKSACLGFCDLFLGFCFLRCHLPMLYIGLEYGLTNNSKLAERFFSQALSIAPEDPFVMHEVGVVAFQNGE